MRHVISAFAERRLRLATSAPSAVARKLNLGCGPVQPSGWLNVDGSRRAWLASRLSWVDWLLVRARLLAPSEFGPTVRIHNLLKPLPWASNSVSYIYSGELWEHFELQDAA